MIVVTYSDTALQRAGQAALVGLHDGWDHGCWPVGVPFYLLATSAAHGECMMGWRCVGSRLGRWQAYIFVIKIVEATLEFSGIASNFDISPTVR